MFDIVDTAFSYGRGLIICSSLQEFSKTKESTMHVIWNVDTAFLLCGADVLYFYIVSQKTNHMPQEQLIEIQPNKHVMDQ